MWADTLLALERGHLQRLVVWGGSSIVAGTLLMLWLAVRRADALLLRHFAIQCAAWGLIDVAICAASWRSLSPRDFAGAQHLLNMLWLNLGLDAGYVGVGATLTVCAWRWGNRAGGMGAGVGVLVQGSALAVLDLWLILSIGPMQ